MTPSQVVDIIRYIIEVLVRPFNYVIHIAKGMRRPLFQAFWEHLTGAMKMRYVKVPDHTASVNVTCEPAYI